MGFIWDDQPVAKTLVVAFCMITRDEFVDGFAQRAFTKEDHSVQAGFFYAADEALRVGI
jgi:hypothetical protein